MNAYDDFCRRWAGGRPASAGASTEHRFFKLLFAAPLVCSLVIGAAALSGLPLEGSVAALLFSFAAILISAALASGGGLKLASLPLWMLAIALGAVITAVSGLAALPLAGLIAAVEAYYVTRSAKLSLAQASLAALAALCGSGFAGIAAPSAASAAIFAALGLVWFATLPVRRFNEPETAAPPRPLSELMLDARQTVRALLSATGEILHVEGDCVKSLGLSAAALSGFGLYERILVGDRVAYLSALDEARTGCAAPEAMVRLQDPAASGAYFCVNLAFFPIDGKSIALSLTPSVENRRVQENARTAEKSEREINSDRYLANVSHELRTPLNAILGFSDILQQEMFGALANDRQREYVGLIHQSGAHLLAVVNMILDVSKIDMGAFHIIAEPFDVGEAIAMTLAMVREQAAGKNIELKTDLAGSAGECTGDRRAFQQILINLLSNAVKFTKNGGAVTVSAKAENRCLEIAIADNGIGISQDDIGRLGRPFFQAHNDYSRGFEGTGLGLSLVKGLVELHSGGLSIESELGCGTTVYVRLPLAGPSNIRLLDQGGASRHDADTGEKNEPAIRKTA